MASVRIGRNLSLLRFRFVIILLFIDRLLPFHASRSDNCAVVAVGDGRSRCGCRRCCCCCCCSWRWCPG
uniref:Putative secreted protein n=1 Tax=Anopheles darlingi TaxID=43151 RepID=A0A2M4DAF9_ANODA